MMGTRKSVVPVLVCLAATLCGGLAAREVPQKQKDWKLTGEKLEEVQRLWAKHGPTDSDYLQVAADYPCGPLAKSASVPTSVHALRPGDIKVVGAMGDSLTAGSGITAKNIFAVLTQNRGLSWSGGGQSDFEDQITMPNILKKYNPDVYGFATGDGDEDSSTSIFNVAVTGSTAIDLVPQARKMIDRMKNDPKVDFENDWKVVTILTGNNDLCDYCDARETLDSEQFRLNAMAALDILQAELPRTLVNFVEPLNMEIVTELNKGLICSALHFFLCECAAFPKNEEAEKDLIRETDLFQLAVDELAGSGRYDTKDDFTVVSQPFFNRTFLPRMEDGQPDLSYFAPDCFHLSRKGQAAAASALWNNMIEKIGSKRKDWSVGETIECPTEAQPFIFTNKNSDGLVSQDYVVAPEKNSDGLVSQDYVVAPEKQMPGDAGSNTSAVGAVVAVLALAAVAVAVVVGVIMKRKHSRRHSYGPIGSDASLF